MNVKKYLTLLLVQLFAMTAAAEDKVYISDFSIKTGEIGSHIILELHTVADPFETVLRVWYVGADKIKIIIFKGYYPSLIGMLSVDTVAYG